MIRPAKSLLARRLTLAALAVLLWSAPTAAALHTYRTGLDSDNDAGTGCAFSLGTVAPGTLAGFERQLTVVVDDDPVPPQVDSAQIEGCVGGAFTDPQALPGFQLELDSGLLGSDSVVGAIPTSLLGFSPTVRLAHHALAASGAEDALFTTDGSTDGPPILVEGVIELIPTWSPFGAVLTTLLVAGAAWWLLRLRPPPSTFSVFLLVLLGLGAVVAVYAQFSEPSATDATADAVPPDTRAEIFASFAAPDGELAVRLDVEDIPFETTCSDATDNDGDGLIDCADPNCAQRACNDANGCTLDDTCQPIQGQLSCVGTPANCTVMVGNECSIDVCQSTGSDPGNDNFACLSSLDEEKLLPGSCTPDSNCGARSPDGTCSDVLDPSLLGNCFAPDVEPPLFLCEPSE